LQGAVHLVLLAAYVLLAACLLLAVNP